MWRRIKPVILLLGIYRRVHTGFRASYIGYASQSVQVVVIQGETVRIVIELEPAELMGEEIEAIGERGGAD